MRRLWIEGDAEGMGEKDASVSLGFPCIADMANNDFEGQDCGLRG